MPRLIVAALVFGMALLIEPRKTVYGNNERYRARPPGEVFNVQRETVPRTVAQKEKHAGGMVRRSNLARDASHERTMT